MEWLRCRPTGSNTTLIEKQEIALVERVIGVISGPTVHCKWSGEGIAQLLHFASYLYFSLKGDVSDKELRKFNQLQCGLVNERKLNYLL